MKDEEIKINTEEEIVVDGAHEEDLADDEFEDLNDSGEELSDKDKIKSLKNKLKEEQKKSKEYLDGWQRARADLVNKEKQISAERIEIYKMANSRILEDLIPVMDSYEMARKNVLAWEAVEKNWRVGIEYIFTQLSSVLESSGLTLLTAKMGDRFDINKMAISEEVETDDEAKDHTVAEMTQSGYELNGKLLREAKVKVFIKK